MQLVKIVQNHHHNHRLLRSKKNQLMFQKLAELVKVSTKLISVKAKTATKLVQLVKSEP